MDHGWDDPCVIFHGMNDLSGGLTDVPCFHGATAGTETGEMGPNASVAGLLGPLLREEGRADSAQTLDEPSCLVQPAALMLRDVALPRKPQQWG